MKCLSLIECTDAVRERYVPLDSPEELDAT